MNILKLGENISHFSDIKIKLIDHNGNEIILGLHKIILISSCEYFKSLLLNNFSESF